MKLYETGIWNALKHLGER